MTDEINNGLENIEPPKHGEPSNDESGTIYRPPSLTYVGNVHALLAGTGPSPTSDGNKGSISRT
jgi:hypothetical protein